MPKNEKKIETLKRLKTKIDKTVSLASSNSRIATIFSASCSTQELELIENLLDNIFFNTLNQMEQYGLTENIDYEENQSDKNS